MGDNCVLVGPALGKCEHLKKKRPFFRTYMAGLGKYHMGGYGRIGVYRVELTG